MKTMTLNKLIRPAVVGVSLLLAMAAHADTRSASHSNWIGIKQFGTAGTERGYTSALDRAGNLYVTGFTTGDLDGDGPEVNAGSFDMFVIKIKPDGQTEWIRQIGSPEDDRAHYIAVDRWGDVYVTGHSAGDLDGSGPETNKGIDDAFLLKLDKYGHVQWLRQFGSEGEDMGFGLAVDTRGNTFVAGYTFLGDMDGAGPAVNQGNEDVFLAAFDAAGNQRWVTQVGSPESDVAYAVAVDQRGSVYMTGLSFGDLDGPGTQVHAGDADIVTLKFNRSGELQWVRQVGTPAMDFAYAMKFDNKRHLYVSGFVSGDLDGSGPGVHAGQTDLAVLKIHRNGDLLWSRQLGTAGNDIGHGVAVDKYGAVYAVGVTSGDLDGAGPGTYQGRGDIVVAKFSRDGAPQWIRQWGSASTDLGLDITVDRKLQVYVTGQTEGDLDGSGVQTHAGDADLFVLKFSPPPQLCIGKKAQKCKSQADEDDDEFEDEDDREDD